MLRYDVGDRRVTLTIDDPERHNPLTNETMAELATAVERATGDPEASVIVITGAGDKAFSAGGDLASGFMDDALTGHAARGALADLFRGLRRCAKPTIARVNGHALGGGFGLVAACDISIAVDGALLGTPEVRVGLWPMIITAPLKEVVPQKALFEMMATGRRISADEARALGIVSRVVSAADLDDAVDGTVDALLDFSPAVLAQGKDSFYAVRDMDFDTALDHLQQGLTSIGLTDDAAEGIAAFGDKRDPAWKGR